MRSWRLYQILIPLNVLGFLAYVYFALDSQAGIPKVSILYALIATTISCRILSDLEWLIDRANEGIREKESKK